MRGEQGGWVPEYYSEASEHEDAEIVLVKAGEETEGINFTMETGE